MALGLIQFLIGGKKKKSNSKSAQAAVSVSRPASNGVPGNQIPDGVSTPTENVATSQQSAASHSTPSHANSGAQSGGKKSVSEALIKIHKELQESNERLTGLVTDVKNLENGVNSLTHRVDDLDKKNTQVDEKFQDIDSSMSKFLSLYELINNQYNPFVSNEMESPLVSSPIQVEEEVKEDNSNGTLLETQSAEEMDLAEEVHEEPSVFKVEKPVEQRVVEQKKVASKQVKTITVPKDDMKLSQSLLELDTLNIEEAAADCVPLTRLKNNTNGLVIILSWLEYLIKKVGVDEARNTLRYYTETLRWLTPEVFFDLDKYLRGMNDVEHVERNQANVKDHIVSLYFISKLNEKSLDHRLTKAVLDIIQN